MKRLILTAVAGLLISLNAMAQPYANGARAYGPTAPKETLWSIAERMRPNESISVQQMMLALFKENPRAFNASNINALKKGVTLKLPSMATINSVNSSQAKSTNKWQTRNWNKAKAVGVVLKEREVKSSKASLSSVQKKLASTEAKLRNEQRKTRTLKKQLAQAKSVAASSVGAATVASQSDISDPALAGLKAKLKEFESIMGEKDTHITNLKGALKVASETIKSQQADNQRLYDTLKRVSPESVKTDDKPVSSDKPRLTLSSVDETSTTPTNPITQHVTGAGGNQVSPITPPVGNNGAERSKLPLILAIVVLLFILAMLWRALSRNKRRMAVENRMVAEPTVQTDSVDSDDVGDKEPQDLVTKN